MSHHDHDHDRAAEDVEVPDLPAEDLHGRLQAWCDGYVSGYVSMAAASHAAAQAVGGALATDWSLDDLTAAMERQARNTVRAALADPITRHVIVDNIQRHAAGLPVVHVGTLEITTCTHPDHGHGG